MGGIPFFWAELAPYGELSMNFHGLYLIFSVGYCIMVSMIRERMLTVKKLMLVSRDLEELGLYI